MRKIINKILNYEMPIRNFYLSIALLVLILILIF